jgi:transcription elongation GreA/GreB family factor
VLPGLERDMENTTENKNDLKNRQLTRIFNEINDEIALLTATAKFNYTTCKTDQQNLNITLDYIEDTKKLATILKTRIKLLIQATN